MSQTMKKLLALLVALPLSLMIFMSWGTVANSAVSTCQTPYTTSMVAGPCNNCDSPSGIAGGNLNGDSMLDFVVANQGSVVAPVGTFPGSISIHIATGPATYANTLTYRPPNGFNPFDVELADFNGDTKLDLATVFFNSSNVTVQFGDGLGNFGTPTYYSVGPRPYSIAVGDFNNDGKPDLVTANSDTNTVTVLLNSGTGTFPTRTDVTAGAVPRHVAVGDLNNDGKADLVVTSTANIFVLLGTGTGSFGAPTSYTTGTGPIRLLIRDLNNDSNADVVVSNVNANSISVLFGTGTGTLGVANNYTVGTSPRGLASGDFNGDGLIDIAVGVNGAINVLLATSPGAFAAPTTHGPYGANDIFAGDVNADGGIDLVFSAIAVLLNTCSSPDLMLTKTHSGIFHVNTNGVYTLTVKNNGGAAIGGTTTVTDTLPTGLSYVSGTGTNWNCSAAGQVVTCTTNDVIPAGSSTAITLTVLPSCLATPGVTNTASVSNPNDPQPGNNSASDPTQVLGIVPANFDGDFKTDVSIWQPNTGNWVIIQSSNDTTRVQPDWGRGSLGDKPVPGDYDGDGTTDIAIFRPSEGNWYIILSSTNTIRLNNWGGTGDIPVPRDYDGDLKTDIAVFRPSDGNWYVIRSSNGTVIVRGWGMGGDKPVPGDYDGDCVDDFAVFRPSEGNWYVLKSATNTGSVQNWGATTDQPVQGDYDGDHKFDLAVYRATEGNWYVLRSSTGTGMVRNWGTNNDKPVPGDYDGDGKTDFAVWRPSEGAWYVTRSGGGNPFTKGLGVPGDVLLPATYIPQ